MNIHLIVIFGRSGENSPLSVAMRHQGVTLTTFADAIRLNYPQKILRVLVGLPRLLWFSFVTATKSLRRSPHADAVIVSSHFDLLAFGLLSKLLRRQRPKLVFPGFIFTSTSNPWLARLKHGYYQAVLRNADIVVCHSRLEVEKNNGLFPGCLGRFVYYPYSIHVAGATGYTDSILETRTIMSAGRSGRDYGLLIEAVRGLDVDLHIVCDQFPDSLRARLPDNVRVLANCYGQCYFEELSNCRFVVVPLGVKDISAGQMVLLQAMAMGRPTVITHTATTVDYVQDGGVITVQANDLSDLRDALQRLSSDDALCASLGRQAADVYADKYSIDAYAAHLVDAARIAVAGPARHGEPNTR